MFGMRRFIASDMTAELPQSVVDGVMKNIPAIAMWEPSVRCHAMWEPIHSAHSFMALILTCHMDPAARAYHTGRPFLSPRRARSDPCNCSDPDGPVLSPCRARSDAGAAGGALRPARGGCGPREVRHLTSL